MSTEGELERGGPGMAAEEAPGAGAAEPAGPQAPLFISTEQYVRVEPESPVDAGDSASDEEAPGAGAAEPAGPQAPPYISTEQYVRVESESAVAAGDSASEEKARGADPAEPAGPENPPPIWVEPYRWDEPEEAVDAWVSTPQEDAPQEDAQEEDEAPAQVEALVRRRVRIREFALLPLEKITHVFAPQDGLIADPTPTGQLLVLTSQRLIAFCEADARNDTYLVPTAGIKHVSITSRTYNTWTLLQGLAMVLAGVFVYLALGYWLTGLFDGPTIPVIHMDLAPLIALILILAGGVIMVQVYMTRPGGTINFQVEGLQVSFPFRGTEAQQNVYEVVNAFFLSQSGSADEDSPVTESETVEGLAQPCCREEIAGEESGGRLRTGEGWSAEE